MGKSYVMSPPSRHPFRAIQRQARTRSGCFRIGMARARQSFWDKLGVVASGSEMHTNRIMTTMLLFVRLLQLHPKIQADDACRIMEDV